MDADGDSGVRPLLTLMARRKIDMSRGVGGRSRRQAWSRNVAGMGAGGAGAEVEVAVRAGARAAAVVRALEVVIFRAREGAGGHQMRGGWGPSSLFRHCESDRAEL